MYPVFEGSSTAVDRVLEERALGSDQPHAQLIGFVSHKSFQDQGQVSDQLIS